MYLKTFKSRIDTRMQLINLCLILHNTQVYCLYSKFKVKALPELGLEMDPEESFIAPLLLRVIPIHPPILKYTTYSTFHKYSKLGLAPHHTRLQPFYAHHDTVIHSGLCLVFAGLLFRKISISQLRLLLYYYSNNIIIVAITSC